MAITNAQQYKSMLVKKRKDGKRPGYYGPDAGHENDPGTGGKSNNNNSGGNKGSGGGNKGSDRGHSRFASDSGYYGKKQGSTFETFRGGRNIGIDNKLASKYGTETQKDRANKALAKGNLYSASPNQSFFEKANTYNSNFQRNKMIDLAKKRSFQKYQDIEQYVNPMDDYGLTAEDLAKEVAKDPSYGYDFSDLETGKAMLGSNIGTSLESYRPNLYDVNSNPGPSVIANLLNATRPDTQVTALNTLNKARDYTNLVNKADTLTNQELRDEMTNLKNRGKTEDQINPPDRGNDQQDPCKGPNPPAYCFIGGNAPTEEPAEEESPQSIPYRLMNMGGDTEDAPLMAGAPELKLQGDVQPKQENMMMAEIDPFLMEEYEKYVFDMEEMGLQPMTFEEFRREAMSGMAGGGIAGIRQGYFLGGITKSIKKAVKGATRAVKKVAKSPLGKAALFAGLGAYGLGAGPFSSGKFGAGFLKSPKFLNFMFKDGVPGFSTLTKGGMMAGLGALSALPLLGIGTEEEEEGEEDRGPGLDITGIRRNPYLAMQRSGNPYRLMAEGGNAEPVAKDVMPLLDMGGKEKDYRETGGFVDMGRMEKADDVPARLSKNEFVFTADAVRNAGEGDIDKGAEVMYNMMKNLESGGEVSEDSQGLDGARAMFQTSQKLEGVM